MPFLTQGKTNWKFLLIVVVLAVIAGGGIFAWQHFMIPEETEMPGGATPRETEEPYIELISPNGNEKWIRGKTYDIRWESSEVEFAYILLRDKSIFADEKLLAKVNAESNQYSWEVPLDQETGDEFVISIEEVKSTSGLLYDESDNYFSILEDETADWQTYRNKEYGFEIEYPIDWEKGEIPCPDSESLFNINFLEPELDPREGVFWQGSFRIEILPNPEQLSLEDWIKGYKREAVTGADLVQEITDTTLSGKNAKRVSVFGFDHTEIVIITINNGMIYSLSFDDAGLNDPDHYQHQRIYNQILSTFRFIEDEAADWQTYRNERYGFELRYPEEELFSQPLETYERQFLVNDKIFPGVQFGRFKNGCSLVIFKTDRDSNLNPFDEANIPIKERQYTASKKLDSGEAFYHLGMSVASHAVSPEECESMLDSILPIFKFIKTSTELVTAIILETNKTEYDYVYDEDIGEFYLEEFYVTIKNEGNFLIWYDCMAMGTFPKFDLESYENGRWGEGSAVLFSNSVTFLGALGRSPEESRLNPQETITAYTAHTSIPGYKYRLVFYPRLETFCKSYDCYLDVVYSNEFIIREKPELIEEIIGTPELVDEDMSSEFNGLYVFKSNDGITYYPILADGDSVENLNEFSNKKITIKGYIENLIRPACLEFGEDADGGYGCKEWVDQAIFIIDIKTSE